MTDTTETELTETQKAYNVAQYELFQLAAYGHCTYTNGELLTKEGQRQQADYNNRIQAARGELEAALLRLVAEHAETVAGSRMVSVDWLRSLAGDPAMLSLLAVRPDEREADAASAVVPAADRAALRDRIIEVLAEKFTSPGFGKTPIADRLDRPMIHWEDGRPPQWGFVRPREVADAVLSVLSAPAADTNPAPQGVKHSGPNTKFCVGCLSGEHERVDVSEPGPAVEAQPGKETETREADPDCEHCDGSGLDPDAYFVNHDTGTWTHTPCSECLPEDDDTPQQPKEA
jgi:hypothetical protein